MALILTASLLLVPAASADHVEHVEQVEDRYLVVDGHVDEQDVIKFLGDVLCPIIYPVCLEPHYETHATVGIWEETNGCDGLQRHAGDCDGDGEVDERDTEVATVGCERGGTDPCAENPVT